MEGVFVPPGTVLAIRRNLIIFCSLLWHSQSLCGLSLVFITQGALFIALFDFIYGSINVTHENQQLHESVQNVIAAVSSSLSFGCWALMMCQVQCRYFYTLPHRTWHFFLLLYFSRQIKISCISICLLYILSPECRAFWYPSTLHISSIQ